MKFSKYFFLIVFIMMSSFMSVAQKQNFDVVNYDIPKGWNKTVTENGVQLSTKDDGKGNYAAAVIIRSVASTATPNDNFNNSWNNLVRGTVKVSEAPTMSDMDIADGWTCITGQANYTDGNTKGLVTLITATGGGKMANVVIMTNTNKYQEEVLAFVNSLALSKVPQQNENNSIIGTWIKTGSIRFGLYMDKLEKSGGNLGGYMTDEYIFNANGSYQFFSKMFSMTMDKIIFISESGSYKIEANAVTVSPVKSIIESYAKKDGVDKYGALLSSEKRPLEKVAYTFTKHYFSGIAKWNLVLQAKKETNRDGAFSNNTTFSNAWYFSAPDNNTTAVDFPPGFKISAESNPQNSATVNNASANTSSSSVTGLWTYYTLETNGYQQYTAGYMRREYLFNGDGTYIFRRKNWLTLDKNILYVYESGKYSVSGNQLTITPKQGKGQFWSKTNSSKEWGKLVKSTDYKPEKVTYTFQIIDDATYGNGIVLKPGKPTERDGGKFNAANDPYEFRYSFRKSESLIDNPPGF